uniref:Uncharacterized protein n=1 Tax=Timema tahoe TaxID=61484 RepID=A0A7R9P125_9NEOP|nr:unnamed protein product [Timema tahoe]
MRTRANQQDYNLLAEDQGYQQDYNLLAEDQGYEQDYNLLAEDQEPRTAPMSRTVGDDIDEDLVSLASEELPDLDVINLQEAQSEEDTTIGKIKLQKTNKGSSDKAWTWSWSKNGLQSKTSREHPPHPLAPEGNKGFDNRINMCWDQGLNPGPPAERSYTFP